VEFESSANWYPVFQIKQDLMKEKVRLIDELYDESINVWFGGNEDTSPGMAKKMERIEEITRILQALQLGYYKY